MITMTSPSDLRDQGDAGKHPKFDDLGSTAQCTVHSIEAMILSYALRGVLNSAIFAYHGQGWLVSKPSNRLTYYSMLLTKYPVD